MREIAALDPNNAIWADDVRRFEQARHQQREKDILRARKDLDRDALALILNELESTPWVAPPTGSVLGAAQEATAQVRRERARNVLNTLLGEPSRAKESQDVELGRLLRDRWNALAGDAGLRPGAPLLGQAQHALDWLAREDREEERERA